MAEQTTEGLAHGDERDVEPDRDDWRHAEWDRRRKDIGAGCACTRERASDCHYERYGFPAGSHYAPIEGVDDEGCTCLCHVQLIELEKELWPNDAE